MRVENDYRKILKLGTISKCLPQAVADETVGTFLPRFTPKVDDAAFIPAGTDHTLGRGIMTFEVQENCDVTFQLYDWDFVDPKTGVPRDLNLDKGNLLISPAGFGERVCLLSSQRSLQEISRAR